MTGLGRGVYCFLKDSIYYLEDTDRYDAANYLRKHLSDNWEELVYGRWSAYSNEEANRMLDQ